MPRNAFVEPATVRLELSEGDWIEVKRELTYGEQLELQDNSTKTGEDDIRHFVFSAFYLNRLVMWLVDWSFVDDKGAVSVTIDAVKALKGTIAGEINTALNDYLAQVEAKNSQVPE